MMKRLVATILTALAVTLIAQLVVLIRGGVRDIPVLINASILAVLSIGITGFFVGGIIYFRVALAMTVNSTECWESFYKNDSGLTRADKMFFKSCRHISWYFGKFFSIRNQELPLVFFGEIVIKSTIDMLLTFP